MYKIRFLLFLLLLPGALFAQRSMVDTEPLALFKMGTELFQSQKYAAAQMQFQRFIDVSDNHALKGDASYYAAVSAMELEQGDAETLLLNFLRKYPEHPKARLVYYQLGKFYYRQNRFRDAVPWLEKLDVTALSAAERDESEFMLAYTYYKLNENQKAKEIFGRLRNSDSQYSGVAHYYYGIMANEDGDYEDALASFRAIDTDPRFEGVVPPYILQIYLQLERYDEAISYGEEAMQRERIRNGDDIYLYLGEAYFRKENYAMAAEMFNNYGNTALLDRTQQYELGYAYLQTGDYEKSIEAFEPIIVRRDSLAQNAAYHLGDAYVKSGNKLKARNAFYAASTLEYDEDVIEAATFHFGKLSYDNNFQREAINVLRKFIKDYPRSRYADEAKTVLGDILYSTRNYKEALNIIEEIPQRNAKMNEAYQKITYYYGLDQFKSRRYEQAKALFQKSLQETLDERVRALAYFWLGESFYKLNNYEQAFKEYKNFLFIGASKETPYRAIGYYNMGYCTFQLGRYEEALPYFERYLGLEAEMMANERYYDAQLRLADCLFAARNYDGAIANYDKIINKKTQDADYALYQKAIIRGLQNKEEEKVQLLTQLINSHTNSLYIDDAYFEIANTRFNQGNFNQALQEFRNLNRDYPKSPFYRTSLLKIGLILYNDQKDEEAMKYFKQIVANYPYSPERMEALNSIKTIYTERGESEELIAYLKEVGANITISSEDSLRYNAAFSLVRNAKCDQAIPAFEEYLKKFDEPYFAVNARYYLADCLRQSGLKERALANYQFVIDRSPNYFLENATRQAAELQFEMQQYEQALKNYRLLEEVASNKANTITALTGQMRSQYYLADYPNTLQVANRVLELSYAGDELKREAKFYLGNVYLEQNKLDLALGNFEDVFNADEGEMGAEAMYKSAYIAYLTEDYELSQNMILKLRENYPNYEIWLARGFILLADVFVKIGDDFQAKATLQSIINNYPGDEIKKTAREKLAAIEAREKRK
ncbi:MAG: tetratricopeptide repeat protein [Bacteroidia bacterium]